MSVQAAGNWLIEAQQWPLFHDSTSNDLDMLLQHLLGSRTIRAEKFSTGPETGAQAPLPPSPTGHRPHIPAEVPLPPRRQPTLL